MALKIPAKKKATPPTNKPNKQDLLKRVGTSTKRVAPPPIAEPKDVKDREEKAKKQPSIQTEKGTSKEASKPAPSSERQNPSAQPRPTAKGTEDKTKDKRVTVEVMREMTMEERYKLFKSLNKNPETFVPIRKELPKKIEMRLEEAKIRGIVQSKAPKAPKGTDVYYCPYCSDWNIFHYHNWTGYKKCCGCNISTKDFYTSADNGLFGKE